MARPPPDLVRQDIGLIQSYLDDFEDSANGEAREALTNSTGELLIVRNFPLPDRYDPDFVDVMAVLTGYPDRPPIGLYLLERNNRAVLTQLRRIFNILNTAVHEAPTIEGYVWVCTIYQGNCWRYDRGRPWSGDNLLKFLQNFHNTLQRDR